MFGAHASNTPEPDETSDVPGPDRSRWPIVVVALGLIVGAGWFAVEVFGGEDSSAAGADCTSASTTTVSMLVAPAMADLVDEAVDSLEDNGQCIELDVRTASVADVAAAQAEVDEGGENVLPDLWVPDSPAWQSVLTAADLTGKTIVPALASTPVALASGVAGRAPTTWLEALGSPRLVMSDPKASGASALTMLAPFSEASTGVGSASAAQNAIVPVAQEFGAEVAAGEVSNDLTIDTIPAGNKHLIPVTERDFLIARRGNESLEWVVPTTGAAVLNFPLVQPGAGAGGIAVGTGSLDVAGRTGDKIAKWFTSEEGLAAIAGDKLRGADGAAFPGAESVRTNKLLSDPEQAQVDAVMKSWGTLTVPSSILAVIDASGSMDFPSGNTTRMALAVNAAKTALVAFPSHARIGLWAFSINQGGGGQDWQELAPLRRLDAPTDGGGTQIELLDVKADLLPGLTQGGTGLYDTVLGAYKTATREYNPSYYNTVAVLCDGANDDPGSISLEALLKELKKLHDPNRPVRIIPVGISTDADMGALRRIAKATDSEAYEAANPQDILTVLAQGLLTR